MLMVSFNSRNSPLNITVIFLARSPFATAVVTVAMLRTCAVRFAAIEIHVLRQIFPSSGDAFHFRLAAELAFRADFARDARHFRCESAELADHRVYRFCGVQKFTLQRAAFDFSCHSFGQISLRDSPNDSRHLARRLNEISDQIVDRSNCVGPGVGHFADRGALGNPAFLAHHPPDAFQFARHALIGLDHRH